MKTRESLPLPRPPAFLLTVHDVIPVRLPSGTRAMVDLPVPFTQADFQHLHRILALYIEDAVNEGPPTAVSDQSEECMPYLKAGETPAQRIQREIDDNAAVTGLLANERRTVEALTQERDRLRDALREAARIAMDGPLIVPSGRHTFLSEECKAMAFAISAKIRALTAYPKVEPQGEGERDG
ncbi:hypothetical protein [Niveibacterium sp. SC-1]|uniref:hypothetical protein n=1 Tax=Niveibacterium sp. SC-1 TaxID=3135646 RepID=UPI00311FD12C